MVIILSRRGKDIFPLSVSCFLETETWVFRLVNSCLIRYRAIVTAKIAGYVMCKSLISTPPWYSIYDPARRDKWTLEKSRACPPWSLDPSIIYRSMFSPPLVLSRGQYSALPPIPVMEYDLDWRAQITITTWWCPWLSEIQTATFSCSSINLFAPGVCFVKDLGVRFQRATASGVRAVMCWSRNPKTLALIDGHGGKFASSFENKNIIFQGIELDERNRRVCFRTMRMVVRWMPWPCLLDHPCSFWLATLIQFCF